MEKARQPFSKLLVLDFEATCDSEKFSPPEIIEFPVVVFDTATLRIEEEFHQYVRPTVNPRLTPFCTQLTGIQQEWVDKSSTFPEVMTEFDRWLRSKAFFKGSFAFVTCGDWDLEKMLSSQCKRDKVERPEYTRSWVNIKKVFQRFYNRTNLLGMAGMLNSLEMKLEGRHHSGIDDCRNIARIASRLISEGCVIDLTTHAPPPKPPVVVTPFVPEGELRELIDKVLVLVTNETVKELLGNETKVGPKELGRCVSHFTHLEPSIGKLSAKDRKVVTQTLSQRVKEVYHS